MNLCVFFCLELGCVVSGYPRRKNTEKHPTAACVIKVSGYNRSLSLEAAWSGGSLAGFAFHARILTVKAEVPRSCLPTAVGLWGV